jgi:hypothetical protein
MAIGEVAGRASARLHAGKIKELVEGLGDLQRIRKKCLENQSLGTAEAQHRKGAR